MLTTNAHCKSCSLQVDHIVCVLCSVLGIDTIGSDLFQLAAKHNTKAGHARGGHANITEHQGIPELAIL